MRMSRDASDPKGEAQSGRGAPRGAQVLREGEQARVLRDVALGPAPRALPRRLVVDLARRDPARSTEGCRTGHTALGGSRTLGFSGDRDESREPGVRAVSKA